MAQSYNFNGVNLVIPGSYVNTTVINNQSGANVSGVVAIIGEAEGGPDYSVLPKDLSTVAFRADQLSLVQSLFVSGPLVDAFANLTQPFKQAGLLGGPTLIYCIKTNATGAAKASKQLQFDGSPLPTLLATFEAKNYGTYGNDINVKATALSGDLAAGTQQIELIFSYGTLAERFVVSGAPALTVENASPDTCTIVTTNSTMTVTVGTGTPETYQYSKFKFIRDLAKQISKDFSDLTVTESEDMKFNACAGVFDVGTVSIATADTGYLTTYGKGLAEVDSQLVTVVPEYTIPTPAIIDIDDPLANGAKGSTELSDYVASLAKLEKQRINFIVPLFSSDIDALLIDDVISETVQHVVKCSKIKANRNRQAFLSLSDTYANVKSFVSNGAKLFNTPSQYRTAMYFQSVLTAGAGGAVQEFEPWMLAVIAAGAQSVAGYRPIFNKSLNIVGVIDPDGFNEQYEDALYAGLMPVRLSDDGVSQIFVSDQTTYLVQDNNFVYNSVQAVYGADVIAMTLQQQMQTFVGESVADVSANVALSFLQSVLAGLLRNKWISASSDAPSGYKNASVSINAPVMNVSVECKESTGIYFVPINLSISNVTSSA